MYNRGRPTSRTPALSDAVRPPFVDGPLTFANSIGRKRLCHPKHTDQFVHFLTSSADHSRPPSDDARSKARIMFEVVETLMLIDDTGVLEKMVGGVKHTSVERVIHVSVASMTISGPATVIGRKE